jgi:hypothetical protein
VTPAMQQTRRFHVVLQVQPERHYSVMIVTAAGLEWQTAGPEHSRICTMGDSSTILPSLKRKAESSEDYSPSQGSINLLQFRRAVNEFRRKESDDKQVLLAKDVRVRKWLHSGINENMGNVFVMAVFKSGDNLTDSTVGDLWIVKVQNRPHERVVQCVGAMLVRYQEMYGERLLVVGGGNLELPGCIRRPDNAVSPRGVPEVLNGQRDMPRMLFEVEFEHRSIGKAHRFCLEYFQLIPELRAVVLIVFYGKRVDGTFAAVAVHYQRAGAVGAVVDAVSFGTAPIFHTAFANIPVAIRTLPIRILPLAPHGIMQATPNPWTPADHAYIRVAGADLFHLGPGADLIPGTPAPPPDCLIDFWKILLVVEYMAF